MCSEPLTPHVPVLKHEVLHYLKLQDEGCYIDGTIGYGGHASSLLEAPNNITLLGIDRDKDAIDFTKKYLAKFGKRVHLVHGNFSLIKKYAELLDWENVNGVLLDLGVSSYQIDMALRGFSFQVDGPLDMRMNQDEDLTAEKLLNTATQEEIESILRQYGEEPKAKRIAKSIVRLRQQQPLTSTIHLATLIQQTVGKGSRHYISTIARCFQAFRIAVNEELEHIRKGLESAIDIISPGGRLVVISFHSLEDRIVKSRFRYEESTCICPPKIPICQCKKKQRLRVITKRPITVSQDELKQNSRARSAKLRVAERI